MLNVLGEEKSGAIMKHFLTRFPPGADRFEGVGTKQAKNGSPVLTDSIAYLECTVRASAMYLRRLVCYWNLLRMWTAWDMLWHWTRCAFDGRCIGNHVLTGSRGLHVLSARCALCGVFAWRLLCSVK